MPNFQIDDIGDIMHTSNLHSVIVPGVGGSEAEHWQSWLQQVLPDTSRVQQQWQQPILPIWAENWKNHVQAIQRPMQIIAHSFGCLTTLYALHHYPELQQYIQRLILVAPANPIRFGEQGFAQTGQANYWSLFKQIKIQQPTTLIISENDTWLDVQSAQQLAQAWGVTAINLGQVGHINVASGFGAFPQILPYVQLPTAHLAQAS